MKTIQKECQHCKNFFDASLKEHKRGNAKFCTPKCSSEHRKGVIQVKEPNCTCQTCGTPFYRNASRMKLAKHGYYFCNRVCKDKAQKIGTEHSIEALFPSHYRDGTRINYRKTAILFKELKCEDCGYDKYPEILQVHHIDRNRSNNELANLKFLCPTCHEVDHFLNHDGRYSKKNGGPPESRTLQKFRARESRTPVRGPISLS